MARRQRHSQPPHPTLNPELVNVNGHRCLLTFTYKLRTYVARIDMPDGTTVTSPGMPTKDLARAAAWDQANGQPPGPRAA